MRATSFLSACGAISLLATATVCSRAAVATPAGDAGRTVHGVTFAATAPAGDRQLPLRGAGLLRYGRLIPVYAAAFYADPGARPEDPLGDHAKRLEVAYLVSAPARRFNEAGDRILRATLPPAEWEALRPRVATLAAWYPDPKPGDRCALVYTPESGTQLYFNDRLLGTIPGDDFQRAYFRIWLGEAPASVPLRDALLARR